MAVRNSIEARRFFNNPKTARNFGAAPENQQEFVDDSWYFFQVVIDDLQPDSLGCLSDVGSSDGDFDVPRMPSFSATNTSVIDVSVAKDPEPDIFVSEYEDGIPAELVEARHGTVRLGQAALRITSILMRDIQNWHFWHACSSQEHLVIVISSYSASWHRHQGLPAQVLAQES
ncbi:hypothetical protein F5Y18DRAFT_432059 [Xylariaceae sp. FL1019]|nr:hypothetical protein F5Y18DRAFT_432059 [Xylariaceae sp. FL1019]